MKRLRFRKWSRLILAGSLALWSACSEKPAVPKEGPGNDGKKEDKSKLRVERSETGDVLISVPDAIQKRIGLKTEELKSSELGAEIKGYGRVLDPGPLAALAGDIAAAQTAAGVSQQEVERVKAMRSVELHAAESALKASSEEFARQKKLNELENASAKTMQAAEAAAVRDQLQLATQKTSSERALQTAQAGAQRDALQLAALRAKLVLLTTSAILDRPDHLEFLSGLVGGSAALVRIDLPAGESIKGNITGARILALDPDAPALDAELLGAAANTDPQTQGAGFLFVIKGSARKLPPGAAITGWLKLSGNVTKGFVIPRDAIVRYNGTAWAYVSAGDDDFRRTEIPLDHPVADGWNVTGGFKDKEKIEVVVTGAGQLLSEELKSQGND